LFCQGQILGDKVRNGKFHALRKISAYFKTAEYLGACFEDEAISNIKIKNTTGLAPLDSLLLYLIHLSLFSFRPSFPYLPSVIPAKAGIQSGLDPASSAG